MVRCEKQRSFRRAELLAFLCLVAAAFLITTPNTLAVGEPWGCCIPDAGECFDGVAYTSNDAFRAACNAAQGDIIGSGAASTCSAFDQCDLGCCCAGDDVFGSPAINSDESLLRATRAVCAAKTDGTWDFSLPTGSATCVQTCGGEPGTGGTGEFSVSGHVVNATGGQPLADAGVFIPVPDGDIADTTGADGAFTLAGIPEMSTRVFAIHPSCRPTQSPVLRIDQDITNLTIAIDCTIRSCQHAIPALDTPTLVRGTSEASFTVTLQDTCSDLVQIEPFRCDGQRANCVALPPQSSPAIRDAGLASNTTYCYKVRARFGDGTTTESANASGCVTTGDLTCMGRAPDDPPQWCGTAGVPPAQSILSCSDQNRIQAQACTGSMVCVTQNGQPRCVEPPACTMCNGLLGFFSFLDLEIVDGLFTRACSEVCVLDSQVAGTPTIVDAYGSCMAYGECSQYRSSAACEQDRCTVGRADDPCAWSTINAELGTGVCANARHPACDRCDELFGSCNEASCQAISPDCYYDGDPNGLSQALGCVAKSEMSCRRYDDAADCTGGPSASFDIHRDAQGAYTGGSNARSVASHDLLGFGSCDWGAEKCFKDADERNAGEDDCIENERFFDDQTCLSDLTPPNTSFFLNTPPVYSRVAVRTLPFVVLDDRTPVDAIRTYVCFGTGCVPTATLSAVALPEEGRHMLRFFSVDASENYEPVKQIEIIIKDTHEAALDQVVLEEDR